MLSTVRDLPRTAVLLLAATALLTACGGGGGGGGSGDAGGGQASFKLQSVSVARPIYELDGSLVSLVNPASLHEVDSVTGLPLAGFPKPLNPGGELGKLSVVNLQQIGDPLTPQIPIVPRNAAFVLDFTAEIDPASLRLDDPDGDGDGLLTAQSPVQVQRKGGAFVKVRAILLGKRLVIVGRTGDQLAFEASPLAFDSMGNVVSDPLGHLRVVLDATLSPLLSLAGAPLAPRPDGLGTKAKPLPFNPGNGALDALVLQTEDGKITFNGFLPDLTAPRLVRPVTLAGTITALSSSGGAPVIEDDSLGNLPNTAANGGLGEWAGSVLTVQSAGGSSTYAVASNTNAGSVARFVLKAGQALAPSVSIGDDFVITRSEYFEPIPPPLPTNPAKLKAVTVDPVHHPRDPDDPQDLLNSDLRYFVRAFDEDGVELTDRWDPASGTFLPLPPRVTLSLLFNEPMDASSFRPYETFYVTDGSLPVTDPAFQAMFPGRALVSDDGLVASFRPELLDQNTKTHDFIGFGGTPSAKRLVLRVLPPLDLLTALKASATPAVAAKLLDATAYGLRGITDLGGRSLGVPPALLDQGDAFNFLLASTSAGRGALPPALDFPLVFETLPSDDPDHGVIVHRFLGQPESATFSYPAGVVADTVQAGVEYKDYPPLDKDNDGTIDRRFIYGPRVVDVGLNLPNRLTGSPATAIQHVIDNFNKPKPGTFSNPNGEDFLISAGFGASVPLSSPYGARFQHIYRATDASPSKNAFQGVYLDLVGLAWAPIQGNVAAASLNNFEIVVGLSGVNRGRGPNTNQTNGIPQAEGSGLNRQFDCNFIDYHHNCCNDNQPTFVPQALQTAFETDVIPPRTSVVKQGTPYNISPNSTIKPLNASGANFNPYVPFPKFNGGFDPFFGKSDVFSFPYDNRFPMLIEYQIGPNQEPPGINVWSFSPGILSSVLPRFRVWSQGQHPLAHCVPNWTLGVSTAGNGQPPFGSQPSFFFGGEGGPLLEPGRFHSPVFPPEENNGMPVIMPVGYILPPKDGSIPCSQNRPSLQPTPNATSGMIHTENDPLNGCITKLPTCNDPPQINWYFANGMLAYPLPLVGNLAPPGSGLAGAYPGPQGQPPTHWIGYGIPFAGTAGVGPGFPNQPPCLLPFNSGSSAIPGVTNWEPGMQGPPQRFGDNARYFMLWNYRKRVSVIESPTLQPDSSTVVWLRPIVEPPLDSVPSNEGLRVEIRAGTQLDFAVAQLASPFTDVREAAFSDIVTGENADNVYVKFRASFGTAPNVAQPPSLETIIIPYRKGAP